MILEHLVVPERNAQKKKKNGDMFKGQSRQSLNGQSCNNLNKMMIVVNYIT